MDTGRLGSLLAAASVLLGLDACGGTHRDVHPDQDASSGGSEPTDAAADEGAAGSGGTLGTFLCGGKPCNGATSYCLTHTSYGGPGGGSPTGFASCNPIPTLCAGEPHCDCLDGAGIGFCNCYFEDGGYVLSCHSTSGAGGR